MAVDNFFRTMAEEKGIIDQQFSVVVDGICHFMEVNQIIDLIEMAPSHEQATAKKTFSMIDFKNGDLMHYIEFLAKAFIQTNYNYQYQ